MKPTSHDPLHPKVVLGVGAHPDDIDFIAGGSLAKFAASGAQVYYLIVTDGSRGSDNTNISPDELKTTRHAEQAKAVAAIGAAGVEFLDHCDGLLEVTMDLKKEIVKVIRRLKPDVVVSFDPTMAYYAPFSFINHPDHRAAGQATLDAVFPLARDRLSFPDLAAEGLEPHKVTTILLSNFEKQDFLIDVSDTMDAKIGALKAHDSQIANMDMTESYVRELAQKLGSKTGSAYAEGFVRIDAMQ